ncbi:FAD-dependent oxidoreductase [Mesorhizobium sp. M0910]|uniref:FAD-dependent oxidoreductase n=1 Tax=Mesorhizobium sp. M0910 TaxID=2957025 RepID=UPI00333AB67A
MKQNSRRAASHKLHNQLGGEPADWEMIDRSELERLMPGVTLGSDVCGASFGRRDGHVNPLRLLSALQSGIQRLGGTVVGAALAQKIRSGATGFTVETRVETSADRLFSTESPSLPRQGRA